MSLDPDLARLARGKNFAALTTLMSDGQPQTQIMWVDADDDALVINTEVGRQEYRNVEADPRVTVTIFDAENPYRYIEARVVSLRRSTATRPGRTSTSCRRSTWARPMATRSALRVRRAADRAGAHPPQQHLTQQSGSCMNRSSRRSRRADRCRSR